MCSKPNILSNSLTSSSICAHYSTKLLNFKGLWTIESLTRHLEHVAEYELNTCLKASSLSNSSEWRLLSREWGIPREFIQQGQQEDFSFRILQWNVLAQGS